jgi:glycosyltransferase involved in cell wall biosynthesis
MRVLMLTTQLGYGGAETSFIRLANFLAQSMDVTVALFTNNGTYDAGHEALHTNTVLLDTARGNQMIRWIRRIVALRALKRQHDITISFLSGPNLVNVLAGYNARTIVSLRGSRMYDPVVNKRKKLIFQYLFDPIIFYLARRIVPVSAGLTNEVRIAAGKRMLAKIRIISPFVERVSVEQRLTESVPESYASLKGQKVIVAVGRLSTEKGFQHLIRVFAQLNIPSAKLLLVGNGPMERELREQCARLNIEDSVIFAGYHENVLPFMKLGTLYAMTSATEGFPNVLLEAMAAGLAVIAADTPWGVRSILSDMPAAEEPYPTQYATRADYGTLMPRIDDVANEMLWIAALAQGLQTPQPSYPQRINDFDIVKIGEKWKALIHELS